MPTVRIEELRAEARYRREQRDLYRARVYGGRPTSVTRLRELERRVVSAEGSLARALEHSRLMRHQSRPPVAPRVGA